MNKITEQIDRFNSLKKNLKIQDIDNLTTSDKTSILNIFIRKINIPSNSLLKLENTQKNFIAYNPIQYNHDVKNKFFTKKLEPNTVKENKSKEISPLDKNDKSKNTLIGNYSNGIKNYHKENNINDNDSKSIISKINLLNLENGEVKMNEARDIFQQEERKNKEMENQKKSPKNEEGKKNYNYDNELDEDLVDSDLDEFDINDEWKAKQNEEKEKCKIYNNKINKERLKSNLILSKEESKINFHEKMNLFDENEIMKDSDSDFLNDKDDYKEEENNNFNKEEGNNFFNNDSQAKNINNQNSSNIYSYENNNKKSKNDYYVTPFQDKENKINENDKQNVSNYTS